MGLIVTRFHVKRTCLQELEIIEEKILELEKYHELTERQQRQGTGRLAIYSFFASIVLTTVFCNFFSVSLTNKYYYIMILIIFPFILTMVKKIMKLYYLRQINVNLKLLCQLKADKQQILDTVMERETYKVARKILERFAPNQIQNSKNCPPGLENVSSLENTSGEVITEKTATVRSVGTGTEMFLNHRAKIESQSDLLRSQQCVQNVQVVPCLRSLRPRPILPAELGLLERLVEYLIGDGPNYRFALICSKCHGHNGMALPEEFPFLSYRCCYCWFYNQSKKQRPISPKIQLLELHRSDIVTEPVDKEDLDGSNSDE